MIDIWYRYSQTLFNRYTKKIELRRDVIYHNRSPTYLQAYYKVIYQHGWSLSLFGTRSKPRHGELNTFRVQRKYPCNPGSIVNPICTGHKCCKMCHCLTYLKYYFISNTIKVVTTFVYHTKWIIYSTVYWYFEKYWIPRTSSSSIIINRLNCPLLNIGLLIERRLWPIIPRSVGLVLFVSSVHSLCSLVDLRSLPFSGILPHPWDSETS